MFGRPRHAPPTHTNRGFVVGLSRAFAGALLFSFPMFMTMEMWWLGFTIEPARLLIVVLLTLPLLTAVSYYVGFEDTGCFLNDLVDAFVAFAVGFLTSAAMLFLFDVIHPGLAPQEILGKIVVQTLVAALGAILAQSQLGGDRGDRSDPERRKRHASYTGQLFLMAVGAIFLGMSPAPTDEIPRIAHQMHDFHVVILALATLLLMHAFVYYVGFHGQEKRRHPKIAAASVFLRFTVAGYALVLVAEAYLLWTFGRFDGVDPESAVRMTVVASFPGALGAAASRLLL